MQYFDLTKVPEGFIHAKDELEVYKGKWRNLLFLKDGTTRLGCLFFDKMEYAQLALDFCRQCGCGEVSTGEIIYNDQLSHAFPMPVKE